MTSPARQAHLGGYPSLRGPSWFSWLIRWPRQLGKLILGGTHPWQVQVVFLIDYMTSPARQAHLGGDPSLTGPSWFFDWLYDLASSASSSWGGPIPDRSKLFFWLIRWPRQLGKLILGGTHPWQVQVVFLIDYMTSPARQAHLGGTHPWQV